MKVKGLNQKYQNLTIYIGENLYFIIQLKELKNQENLRKYTYNLCPIGNGIDTYRIWETLVAGSIPITKDHIAFKNFKNFPIIFLENLKINNLEAIETLSKK